MATISQPTNREEFKQYIRWKLGEPTIQLNVAEQHVDIAVDEALKWFQDYHYNGSYHVYYAKTLSQPDIDARGFELPDDIIGVTEVFSLDQTAFSLSADMFSGGYQMLLDMSFNMSNGSVLSFYMNKVNYDFISQMIIGQTPIRFNQHQHFLYIDKTWKRYAPGDIIIVDCYQKADPDVATDIWSDRWLIRYAVAKLQYIWGEILSKYSGMTLPGNVQFNGERILNDAKNELDKIEEAVIRDYSIPPRDVIA